MSDFPSVPQNVRLNTDAPGEIGAAFFNTFNTAFKQARLEHALEKAQSGDPKAMTELYKLSPELALRLDDQHRKQASLDAEGKYLVASNPNDPNIAAAVAEGADPAHIVMTNTRQSRQSAVDVKNVAAVHGQVMSILGAVQPGDDLAWANARARAKQLYGDIDLDTSYIDKLPDHLTPELKLQLQNEGATTSQQLNAHISQERVDETGRHNKEAENIGHERNDVSESNNIRSTTQSNTNNVRSTTTSSDNNIRSTNQSNINNVRSTSQSNTNSERSAGRRHGHGGRSAVEAAPDGTIFKDKTTGKRYIKRNGQPVPYEG